MNIKLDFTDCEIDYFAGYDGSNGRKDGILYKNTLYMLKTPPIKDNKKTNACISEYIGCHIAELLGLNVQKTLLGTYKDDVVVICKDFTTGNNRLINFTSIKNSLLNSSKEIKGLKLEEILETINHQKYVDRNKLTKFFWDTFILDSLIANGDRHNENWGVITNREAKTRRIAPIYDCGSSFHPKLMEKEMIEVLENKNILNELVTVNPRSAVFIKNKGINYYNFLTTTDNEDCLKSLKKIHSRIDLDKINKMIEAVPYISNIHKLFLKTIVKERKEKILEKALEINRNFTEKTILGSKI